MLILKGVEVVCFDTLLQVLILNQLAAVWFDRSGEYSQGMIGQIVEVVNTLSGYQLFRDWAQSRAGARAGE